MKSALFFILTMPSIVLSQSPPDTTIKVTVGGFVDAYYGYDFGRPPVFDRSFEGGATFTTQPARHNEFNINLAYFETVLSGNRLRGRLAFQAGTSVQSNYAGEPTNGAISGPLLGRHIQEAYAGYQVTPSLWIDGGVFFSHMGMEGWISKDNLTYTRSLVAEYSPYYSSGARAVWAATPKLTGQLHVVNGWQNISETNTDKAVGIRLDYAATSTLGLAYYNFFQNEVGGRLRTFNGVGAKLTNGKTSLLGELDVGTLGESSSGLDDATNWWGYALIARYQATPRIAVSGRVEGFDDEDQVVIVTGLANPFSGPGVSIGLDVSPQSRLLWRTELRGFHNDEQIFPNGSSSSPRRNSGFIVTSLALTF